LTETRKLFHDELKELTDDVVRLGLLAGEAIQAGTSAFLDEDLSATEAVIEADRQLDDLTHAIERHTYLLLARQQPMAVDLRMLVTVLRGIHELERIGDYMVNVAKATRRLYPHPLDPRIRGIIDRMRGQAVDQLKLAVTSFIERDPLKAAALSDMDDVMDDLQKELFRVIFSTAEHSDDVSVQRSVQIALVGRYFERIADHAVNFGERVAYMVTGEFPGEHRNEPSDTPEHPGARFTD
jgi:phosphate transport system protein